VSRLRFALVGLFALGASLGLRELPAGERPNKPGANAPGSPSFQKDVVPFLTKHCYHCHGNGKRRGDLALDKYKDDESVQKDGKSDRATRRLPRYCTMSRPRSLALIAPGRATSAE
jgi:hypothetical protein